MDLSSIEFFHPSFDDTRGLLILNLDHGKANEMGSDSLDAFERLCELVLREPSITCLCTSSQRRSRKGTPIFIAGANVTERADWSDEEVKIHVRRQRTLMQRLRQLPIFTIALTHGVTLGWGVEYLLTCDYTLVTPESSFALPETGLGILPGARGTAELAALVGTAQAMRLGCVGESIQSTEALRIGLVQEAVKDLDAGILRVRSFADQLSKRSPTAIAAFKRASLFAQGRPEMERIDAEAQAYEICIESGDAAIGRAHFPEIRAGQRPPWTPRTLHSTSLLFLPAFPCPTRKTE